MTIILTDPVPRAPGMTPCPRDAASRRVLMVTEMPADFARKLLLTPCASLDAALATAVPSLPPHARIGIMPWANATIPTIG